LRNADLNDFDEDLFDVKDKEVWKKIPPKAEKSGMGTPKTEWEAELEVEWEAEK